MASSNQIGNKDDLLKQAADALDSAHRREEATKLAFSLVERGKIAPFDSHLKFQEKVASIMEKDLHVVREAMDMDVDMADFGKISSASSIPDNAEAAFFHRLAED